MRDFPLKLRKKKNMRDFNSMTNDFAIYVYVDLVYKQLFKYFF